MRNRDRLFLLFAWMLPVMGWSAPVKENKISPDKSNSGIDILQNILLGMQTVQGSFEQLSEGDLARGHERSEGLFWIKRPGLFHWDYRLPFKQQIISDGSSIWYYDPELQQVTQGKKGSLDKTPAALLASNQRLQELFLATNLPEKEWGTKAVRLLPKTQESSFQEITAVLSPDLKLIHKLVVVDSLGVKSRFTLQNVLLNRPIADTIFTFTPPPGVDIIRE